MNIKPTKGLVQNLSASSKAKYKLLKKHLFELNTLEKFSLSGIATEIGISYTVALNWYSHILKEIQTRNIDKAKKLQQTDDAMMHNLKCPSCGRLKQDVTDLSVCRDVFHYQ